MTMVRKFEQREEKSDQRANVLHIILRKKATVQTKKLFWQFPPRERKVPHGLEGVIYNKSSTKVALAFVVKGLALRLLF